MSGDGHEGDDWGEVLEDFASYMETPRTERTALLERLGRMPAWVAAASAGVPEACFLAGKCHDAGVLTDQDYGEAFRYYEAGAELGQPACLGNLARMYRGGQGVEQDLDEAFRWLRAGAESGVATAMYNLGLAYQGGQGVTTDREEALQWYERSGEGGVHEGFMQLGAALIEPDDASMADLQRALDAFTRAGKAGEWRADNVRERIRVRTALPEWPNLQSLLTSEDPEHIQQGLELVLALGPEARDVLTEGITITETGEIQESDHLSGRHGMATLGLLLSVPERCRGLTALNLTARRLEGLPHDLKALGALHELYLGDNRLDRWPVGLQDLALLQVLDLNRNNMEEVPDALGDLTDLRSLNLAVNRKISSLPTTIGKLRSLERLYLGYNQLSSLPDEIAQLHSLRYLGLGYNDFTHLPSCLGELKGLQGLNVTGNNQLTELPSSLAALPNLRRIFAGYGNYDAIFDSARRVFEGRIVKGESQDSLETGSGNVPDLIHVEDEQAVPRSREQLEALSQQQGMVEVVRSGWRR